MAGLDIVEKSGVKYYRSTVYSKLILNASNSLSELWLFSSLTRTQAKKKHEDRRSEWNNKKSTTDTSKTLRDAHTAVCAFERKEVEREGNNLSYVKGLERDFANWVVPHGIADIKLIDFDEPVALRFLRYLRNTGLDPSTQLKVLTAVRRPLRHAREEGWMTKGYDPFHDIPSSQFPQRDKKKRKRVLDNDEAACFLVGAKSEEFKALVKSGETDRSNAVIVNAMEGDRTMETLGRLWNEVDLRSIEEGGTRIIQTNFQLGADGKRQRVMTKNRSEREKVMHPETFKALVRQRQIEWAKGKGRDDDYIFTNADGSPMRSWQLRRATQRAARLAGLGHVNPRDMRRSVCTSMHAAGMPGKEAAAETGHTLETWLQYYVQDHGTQKQREANAAARERQGFGIVPDEQEEAV